MPNTPQIRIGYIKSPARKGDRITVYFANGKSSRFVASNDLTSTNVVVMGDRAFSQDVAQAKLVTTTKLFKSKTNYQERGEKWAYLFEVIEREDEVLKFTNPTWLKPRSYQFNSSCFFELGDGGGNWQKLEDVVVQPAQNRYVVDEDTGVITTNSFPEVKYNEATVDEVGNVLAPLNSSVLIGQNLFTFQRLYSSNPSLLETQYSMGISALEANMSYSQRINNPQVTFRLLDGVNPYCHAVRIDRQEKELRQKRGGIEGSIGFDEREIQPDRYYRVVENFQEAYVNGLQVSLFQDFYKDFSYQYRLPSRTDFIVLDIFNYTGFGGSSRHPGYSLFRSTSLSGGVNVKSSLYDGITQFTVTLDLNGIFYSKNFITNQERFTTEEGWSSGFLFEYRTGVGLSGVPVGQVQATGIQAIVQKLRQIADSLYSSFQSRNTFAVPPRPRPPTGLIRGSEILNNGVNHQPVTGAWLHFPSSLDGGLDAGEFGAGLSDTRQLSVQYYMGLEEMPRIFSRTPGKRQIYCQVENSLPLLLKEIPLTESFDCFISPISTGLEVVIKTGKKGGFVNATSTTNTLANDITYYNNSTSFLQYGANLERATYPDSIYYDRDWGVVEVYKISLGGTLIESPKKYSSLYPNNDVIEITEDNWQKDWVFSYKDHKSIKNNVADWKYDIFNGKPLLEEADYFHTGELPGRDVVITAPASLNHWARSLVGEKAVPIIRAIDPITYRFTEEAIAAGGLIEIFTAYASSSFISCGTMLKDKSFIIISPMNLIDKDDQPLFPADPNSITTIDSSTQVKNIEYLPNRSMIKALIKSSQFKKVFYQTVYTYDPQNNTFTLTGFIEKPTTFPQLKIKDLRLKNPAQAEKEMGILAIAQF